MRSEIASKAPTVKRPRGADIPQSWLSSSGEVLVGLGLDCSHRRLKRRQSNLDLGDGGQHRRQVNGGGWRCLNRLDLGLDVVCGLVDRLAGQPSARNDRVNGAEGLILRGCHLINLQWVVEGLQGTAVMVAGPWRSDQRRQLGRRSGRGENSCVEAVMKSGDAG